MNTTSRQFRRNLLAWSFPGVAFICSACATTPPSVRSNTPESGTFQAIYTETKVDSTNSRTARKSRSFDGQPQDSTSVSPIGQQPIRDSQIQQIAYSEEFMVPDANEAESGAPTTQIAAQYPFVDSCPIIVESCPPEPRLPAAGFNPMGPGMMACDVINLPSPEKYSDEYLCDGGDRDLPVHYDTYNRRSLDTEDTVLEYTDRRGKERTKPSNRVCIYAPRFASVRTVSRPHEGLSSNEVAGVDQLASTQGIHSRMNPSNQVQRESTGRIAVRSRAGGLESEAFQGTVSQLRAAAIHDKLLNVYQSLNFVRSGQIDDTQKVQLSSGMQAGSIWTREEYPIISAKTDMALESHFEQSATSITGIDEKEESENLRIVKLADKKTALPGDVIEFTIRYDNLGGREVHHIRIVDNLTPRLVYIDDSATSDRAGRLVLQDNGEGSQILVWEMDEPLKGRSGGVVTFKTHVR